MIEIQTKRLVFKKICGRDKQILISETGNWEVAKYLSRLLYPYTENDADDWLEKASDNELELNIFKQNKLIGGVGLMLDDDSYYELGYWLGQKNWGKGYAFKAAKALCTLLRAGFTIKNLKLIIY